MLVVRGIKVGGVQPGEPPGKGIRVFPVNFNRTLKIAPHREGQRNFALDAAQGIRPFSAEAPPACFRILVKPLEDPGGIGVYRRFGKQGGCKERTQARVNFVNVLPGRINKAGIPGSIKNPFPLPDVFFILRGVKLRDKTPPRRFFPQPPQQIFVEGPQFPQGQCRRVGKITAADGFRIGFDIVDRQEFRVPLEKPGRRAGSGERVD
jgi:hypothetical protein